MGNGRNIKFWEDSWMGNQCLMNVHSRLYSMVLNKIANIADVVSLRDEAWVWGFEWRRDLYSWEESDLTNLKNTIISSICLQDMSDYWCWTKDRANGYN